MLHSMAQAGSSKKKNKKSVSPAMMILLFAFLLAYFWFAIGAVAYGVCQGVKGTDTTWVVFVFATFIAAGLSLFGSVFATKTQIFDSKDNELLLSMPIPPKYIFISRMIVLLLVNYLLEAVVMLPFLAVFGYVIGFSALGAACSLLVFLLLPFLTLAVSCLIAWVVSEIASRLRNKTIVTVALLVVFLLGYLLLCGSFGVVVGEGGLEDIDLSGLKKTALFFWAGDAMANGNLLSLLLFALCALVPALIAFVILDKSFIRIITTKKTGVKIEYRGNKEKSRSVRGALFKKEIRRFFTSVTYMMNSGVGCIMCLFFAVMLALSASELAPGLESALGAQMYSRVAPVAVCSICIVMSGMSCVSAPSISLEDKNLWILQSSPIDPKDVLMAKLACHVAVCAPTGLISAVVLGVAYQIGVLGIIVALAGVAVSVLFTGYWGLFLGLKFPKFGWQNENVAVKQGFAVFGAMFGSMLSLMILSGLAIGGAILHLALGLLVLIVPTGVACMALHSHLVNGGCVEFENLKK